MGERAGTVFSIARDNAPTPGCTTSRQAMSAPGASVSYFSLAPRTDISAEIYPRHRLLLPVTGELEVLTRPDGAVSSAVALPSGCALLTPVGVPVGVRASDDACVYVEVEIKEESVMNEALEAGSVLKLADLVPYQEGSIVNMDLAHNDTMKLALMAFDAGTGLSEHAAPGEALIFALDGEGVIGYEGSEHVIHAGENFKFDKGGRHYVRAEKRFKMALLLLLK